MSRKKIIMLLSNGFDPDPRVYNEAVSLIRKGYDVNIICWDRNRGLVKPKEEEVDGIRVERIGPRSKHNLGTGQLLFILGFWLRAFLKVLFKRSHAIHCHDFDTLPVGLLIAKMRRWKLIYDAHENYSKMIEFDVSKKIGRLINAFERMLLPFVDLTITVGNLLAEDLMKRGARKVCVVGNWKNVRDFAFTGEQLKKAREELGIKNKQEKLVVSYITTLREERKIKELIEAIGGNEEFLLVLGGKGPLESFIIEKAKEYQNIRYLGFVNPGDIPKYTAISDIIFYGFESQNENAKYSAPNKLFEALAGGKALITGDFGEIGLIVGNSGCGIVLENCEPQTIRNGLDVFVRDPEKLKECKQIAISLGKTKFTWEEAERRLYESYRQIIKGNDDGIPCPKTTS